jgi:hypothetical protein
MNTINDAKIFSIPLNSVKNYLIILLATCILSVMKNRQQLEYYKLSMMLLKLWLGRMTFAANSVFGQ